MNHYEIEASVIRAKKGSSEDLLMLIEQFKPLIFKYSGALRMAHFDTSDLIQTGYVTLINAVKSYKTGSNTFTAYVAHAIKNSLNYTCRKNSRLESELSLNAPVSQDGDTGTEFIDFISSEDNIEEDVVDSVSINELREALLRLSPEEMKILSTMYYEESTLKNYARKKGVSYPQMLRQKKKILQKLSNFL